MGKSQYILGVDIETSGPIIGVHPLLAIGLCVYHWNGNTNEKFSKLKLMDILEVHMEAKEQDYEQDTLNWWKRQDTWEQIKSNCMSKEQAAELLVAFIKKWQGIAIELNTPFKTVTDNCWFDDTWTSWFLCVYGKHVGGLPLRQNYYKGYTKVDHMIDLNQRTKAASGDLCCTIGPFTPSVPHDHTPVSDARGIVERYVNYMKVIAKYRKAKE